MVNDICWNVQVYAVEASSIAMHANKLVAANKVDEVIKVVSGKIEEIELPEQVDVIISEPMGYMLLNERMLETFLHAKKFLKPGGKMFPSRGDLHLAPFTDEALYMEQFNKVRSTFLYDHHHDALTICIIAGQFLVPRIFPWGEPVVSEKCGSDGVLPAAYRGHLRRQHLHGQNPAIRHRLPGSSRNRPPPHRNPSGVPHAAGDNCSTHSTVEVIVYNNKLPKISQTGTVHGIAFWFDVAFIGTNNTVWLSTAPTQPLTHWYQVMFFRALRRRIIIII